MKARPCAAGEKAWRQETGTAEQAGPGFGGFLPDQDLDGGQKLASTGQQLVLSKPCVKGNLVEPGLGQKLLPPGLALVPEIPSMPLFGPLEKCTFKFLDAGNIQKQACQCHHQSHTHSHSLL